ncbi:MAG: TIM barrel protein [Ignavibacteria bacterium]|nr:TIM barrel protein [Ignavibacteria bacterium]
MKFSISNIAWPVEWDKQIFQKLIELGFDSIEIAPNRTLLNGYESTQEQINQWNKQYFEFFSEISSMQSLLFKVESRIFESDETMEHVLKILEKGIRFASLLNVKTIVFGSPSIRNVDNQEQYLRSQLFFTRLASFAKSVCINVALEPNPKIYNTNFLNNTTEAVEYVKYLNQSNLGINLDYGTIIENNELIHDIMTEENIILIKHVHISEPYLTKINFQRRKEHVEFLKSLVSLNYSAYISIEMKSACTFEEIVDVLNYIKAIGIEAGAFYEK